MGVLHLSMCKHELKKASYVSFLDRRADSTVFLRKDFQQGWNMFLTVFYNRIWSPGSYCDMVRQSLVNTADIQVWTGTDLTWEGWKQILLVHCNGVSQSARVEFSVSNRQHGMWSSHQTQSWLGHQSWTQSPSVWEFKVERKPGGLTACPVPIAFKLEQRCFSKNVEAFAV